jgi:hypothetical protein
MPFRALFPSAYHTDTPLEIRWKLLVRAALKLVPLLLDESLQLGEELLDRVEVGRTRRQIRQFHASFTAHLLNSLTVRRIVHDENRVLRRVRLTMVKQLRNKVLEYNPVG